MVMGWGALASTEVVAALLGVVLGGLITGGVTWHETNTQAGLSQDAIRAQGEQTKLAIEAQTAQADREKKAEVYEEFVVAAQGWADKRQQQIFCNCIPPLEVFETYSTFRLKDNNVGIFGTEGARDASQQVVRAIPDTWLNNSKGGTIDTSKSLNLETYGQAVKEFVRIMCTELPPEPNSRCGE